MEFPNGVFADFDEMYVLGSGCFAKLIFFFFFFALLLLIP
jgi:hypothetical protein